MYAVHRIANTRRYRGRISYLEANDEGNQRYNTGLNGRGVTCKILFSRISDL